MQDAGAQRAAACLDLQRGQRVLDACAAPGGKSAHILETCDVELTALDIDAARMRATRAQSRAAVAARGAVQARLHAARRLVARRAVRSHPRRRAVLGLGRRAPASGHQVAAPRAATLAAFAARQARDPRRALAGAARRMVNCCMPPARYSRRRTTAVIERLRRAHAARARLPLPDGGAAQWLPDAEHDGFFYALIEKQPDADARCGASPSCTGVPALLAAALHRARRRDRGARRRACARSRTACVLDADFDVRADAAARRSGGQRRAALFSRRVRAHAPALVLVRRERRLARAADAALLPRAVASLPPLRRHAPTLHAAAELRDAGGSAQRVEARAQLAGGGSRRQHFALRLRRGGAHAARYHAAAASRSSSAR